MRFPRLRFAPLLDLVCLATFVLAGGRQHELGGGVTWFLGVMWPLCVGVFGVALLTKLYVRTRGAWVALTVTLFGGVAIAQVLRGAFMDRPWISVFTVIALTYLGLTMFGWRLVASLYSRRRSTSAA